MLIDDYENYLAPVGEPADVPAAQATVDKGPGYTPSPVEVVLFVAAVATVVVTMSPLWLPALNQALAPYPMREVVTEQVDR